MNELETTRTLPIIATEINSIKDQTRKLILCSSIEIGRRLVEAKSLMAHGEWGNWLKASVDYSQSTANNLMRIFEEYGSDQIPLFGDNSKSQALGNLSYTQAVALLGVPSEEREEFIKNNDIDGMSTRELQQAIRERDEFRKQFESAQNVVTKIAGERDQLRQETETLKSDIRAGDLVIKEHKDTIKKLQDTLEQERQQAKSEAERLAGLLAEARAEGKSEEDIQELTTKLAEAEQQIEKLTEEINKPVTIEPAIVEKVPEEIEQELNDLRKKAEESETAKQTNAAILKYGVYFETLVTGFKNLLEALGGIEDAEMHEKYKQAVSGLLSKMSEKL